jgi:probable HAF family extracellular repeat protein
MKFRLALFTSLSLLAVLTFLPGFAVQAQGNKHAKYTVTDLGTFGGTYSFAFGINNSGMVAGGAATPSQTDFLSLTGFVWDGGQLINLGTLGGSACPGCNSEGSAVSANGYVALNSDTAHDDSQGEDFCDFGSHRQCLAAIWRNGVPTALRTLPGGNNSSAFWVNNRGQIIGSSENGVHDSTCMAATPFQVTRFEAAVWEPNDDVRELRPLEGDTVAFGFGINERGQAVGSSGLCANTTLPPFGAPGGPHAVFWDADGSPVVLASPTGAVGFNVATSISNHDQVVGNSILSDGTIHAFLWPNAAAVPEDLGTFPEGAPVTVAPCCHTINDRGQVVGFSFDADFNQRALVWLDGVATDLNTLVPASSPLYLLDALSINDAGEIVGFGFDMNTFEVHAFLASPIVGVGPAARGAKKPPALPQKVHTLLRRQLHF